jgi:hypothetical protein
MFLVISLMKIRKRSGPNTVPCGTPDVTSDLEEQGRIQGGGDDCLLYRTINCEADAKTLQKDLDTMQQWEAKWLMEFNPDKCEVHTVAAYSKLGRTSVV